MIRCKVNGFIYIGSAAGKYGFYARLSHHRSDLKHKRHGSPILQKHYDRYGIEAFTFHIVEVCPPHECETREQACIDLYGVGSENRSYNICKLAGRAPSPLGRKHTESSKEKLRLLNLGRAQSEESKQKIANANSKEFVVTTPDGTEIAVKNLSEFCRQHGLTVTQMANAARGKVVGHKGYKCRAAGTTREEQDERIKRIKSTWDLKTYVVISPELKVYHTESLQAFCREHGVSATCMSRIARAEMRFCRGWRCYVLNESEELAAKRRALTGKADRYIAESPDGETFCVIHLPMFCEHYGLDPSSMLKVAKGQYRSSKGWTCIKVED